MEILTFIKEDQDDFVKPVVTVVDQTEVIVSDEVVLGSWLAYNIESKGNLVLDLQMKEDHNDLENIFVVAILKDIDQLEGDFESDALQSGYFMVNLVVQTLKLGKKDPVEQNDRRVN